MKGDQFDHVHIARAEVAALSDQAQPIVSDAFHEGDPTDFEGLGEFPDSEMNKQGKERKKRSQASVLAEFVNERCDLIHDKNREPYAFERATRETRKLESRAFSDWLRNEYFQSTKDSARDQSMREALSTLGGIARYTGEAVEINLRVAHQADAYLIDLGDGTPNAVIVRPGQWEVSLRHSCRFVRTEAMQALPVPKKGGDIASLWKYVNVPNDARLLVLAWLLECFRPDTPFPVLELTGEQGSGKSQTQKILRRLVDPNSCDLRGAPKTHEDFFIGGGVNWMLSYENLSHLNSPSQDALCILATGGGFATRRLYTNAEEAVIECKRPCVINGINPVATQQDLIDRCISIDLPVITERVESNSMSADFENERPAILGGLMDVFSSALAKLPKIELAANEAPRLIEFMKFGMAVALALGRKPIEFQKTFDAYRQESIGRTLDASPVATAALEWLETLIGPVELPMKDLIQRIETHKPSHVEAWPRSAKGFGDALRRAAPALRQLGFEVRSMGKVGSTVRWFAQKVPNSSRECRASRAESPDRPENTTFTTFTTSKLNFTRANPTEEVF